MIHLGRATFKLILVFIFLSSLLAKIPGAFAFIKGGKSPHKKVLTREALEDGRILNAEKFTGRGPNAVSEFNAKYGSKWKFVFKQKSDILLK